MLVFWSPNLSSDAQEKLFTLIIWLVFNVEPYSHDHEYPRSQLQYRISTWMNANHNFQGDLLQQKSSLVKIRPRSQEYWHMDIGIESHLGSNIISLCIWLGASEFNLLYNFRYKLVTYKNCNCCYNPADNFKRNKCYNFWPFYFDLFPILLILFCRFWASIETARRDRQIHSDACPWPWQTLPVASWECVFYSRCVASEL